MGNLHCNFCRKSQDEVKRLIAGANNRSSHDEAVELFPFAICDECLACLVSIMGEVDKEWRERQIEVLKNLYSD